MKRKLLLRAASSTLNNAHVRPHIRLPSETWLFVLPSVCCHVAAAANGDNRHTGVWRRIRLCGPDSGGGCCPYRPACHLRRRSTVSGLCRAPVPCACTVVSFSEGCSVRRDASSGRLSTRASSSRLNGLGTDGASDHVAAAAA